MKILRILNAISLSTFLMKAFCVSAAEDNPVACWSFADSNKFDITGNAHYVTGVQGAALKFDGFTTRVTSKAEVTIDMTTGFTVEAWIAPQEYSWNWTAIVDQEKDHREGFSFGINHVGQIGLGLAINGEWQTLLSVDSIPLLKWSHVAASYDSTGVMTVYINGKPSGRNKSKGIPTSCKEQLWLGMSHTKQWPALTERAVSKIPTPMVFDGLIDEVKLYNRTLDDQAVMAAFQDAVPKETQPLQYRRMPSGPDGTGPFGAYYTRLKYCDEWDRLWRVSDYPDIVVRFDELPTRIVFWRGTGYCPAWVSENDRWVSDQGPEIFKDMCFEHMSDKQCRYSHVRIIENTPARILVHWRTALPNVKYETTGVDPQTGWAPWGDDYYYIYPDGVCVRYQRVWGPKIHEFMQSEVICQPGTKPQDNIELNAITIMDLDGNTNVFSWDKTYGKRLPAEKEVMGPIQIINLKSKNRHYVIGETGSHWKPFTFGALEGYSTMPNWNHWPVAQLPNDGRVAPAADRPSSTCLGTLYPMRHKDDGLQEWVHNLYGMTDRDVGYLALLGRSWNNPPELNLHSKSFTSEGYDKSQRAYVLTYTDNGRPRDLTFDIRASKNSPVVNLAVLIKNWGDQKAFLNLNDHAVEEGKSFRIGYRRRLEGVDLIAWVKIETLKPMKVSITSEKP